MESTGPLRRGTQSTTARWHPTAGLSWQWQLTGGLDLDLQTDLIDLDREVDRSVVDYYHSRRTKVICYIRVGSFENWRADADQFPEEVLGKGYGGWSGEKWLDIRQIDRLAPITLARLDLCASKGLDGVEPDNMDIHGNDTGFPLTYEHQLRYVHWLADEAHRRGLAIGQKNAPDQVGALVELLDSPSPRTPSTTAGPSRCFPTFERASPSSMPNTPIWMGTARPPAGGPPSSASARFSSTATSMPGSTHVREREL